ncbi:hypothetical protein [Xenorhabdus bovienii]|uniref:cGAS/DncV-like nucleotidyltransferase C-terminal helical domain-containing protein n=1 Tax=Xenorhabdus bovienii TaxID=40576 RepID=A0A0B6XES9_XENBV|nr:hypothetical protein [Xenorhabdus bovienii]CDM91671.1 conserved protein of unknown function [Xenorhabdus bovienii]
MADYGQKIKRLSERRKLPRSYTATYDSAESIAAFESITANLNKAAFTEKWETRGKLDSATRYALGAMQEVDLNYTRICYETAERVENQLKSGLSKEGINASFHLQGSVPLNIHIKGVSDVDLITIDEALLLVDREGIKASSYPAATRSALDVLRTLRNKAADVLDAAFPAARVDRSGAKSLKITGGSLPREVDVVPAIWWDTSNYQRFQQEEYRGIAIYDSKNYEYICNLPFLHIKRIEDRCDRSFGGLRKAIRLLKNLRADAVIDDLHIDLSSYDIASIMYHADISNLSYNRFFELAVLAETQRWLRYLCDNFSFAQTLYVPNETRKIFEKASMYAELKKLSQITDNLVRAVVGENDTYGVYGINMDSSRKYLSSLDV